MNEAEHIDSLLTTAGWGLVEGSRRRCFCDCMLLIFQIGALISSLFGMAWGAVSAAVVAGVSFFSARITKAGGKASAWFLLPTLLFTIFPLSVTV